MSPITDDDVPRVISLVPSVTETLLAWGVTPVAVTRFCEAPGVPTVGGTKNPDVKAITALSPDLVVMDKEENRADDANALQASGLTVHVTHVRAVAGRGPHAGRPGGRPRAPGDPRSRSSTWRRRKSATDGAPGSRSGGGRG